MLCVHPMAHLRRFLFATLLSYLSFQPLENTLIGQSHFLASASQPSELQDVFVEQIDIPLDPPTQPVAIEVDHQNNLWIVDKLGDSKDTSKDLATSNTSSTKQKFRIITFEDTDRDGRYETSNIFLEWDEEYLSSATPVIDVDEGFLYLGTGSQLSVVKDVDHDGKADIKRDLISEKGPGKLPLNVNGITRAPDGWLFFSMLDHDLNDLDLLQKDSRSPVSAIFKCRVDGSDLQKMATGFNQPGDLVFDSFGNLFTIDQASDFSEETRWIYVIEGGDYGYRNTNAQVSVELTGLSQGHQSPMTFTPILPPKNTLPQIASIQGRFQHIVYAPTNGKKEIAEHHFFANGSGKKSKGVYTFSLTPDSALFKLTEFTQWNFNVTFNDVTMGPEGQLYLTQFLKEQSPDRSAGIYTIIHTPLKHAPESIHTASVLASDLSRIATARLLHFLQHNDQRVRAKAQSALVQRGPSTLSSLVNLSKDPQKLWARLHAIWTIGQLVESDKKTADGNYIQSWIADLLKDPSPEIRAQATILAGHIGNSSIHPKIVDGLKDPSGRVRQMAATAIGKLKPKNAWESILEFVESPRNHYPMLQHAGVLAMTGACSEDALSTLVIHRNPQVRWSSTLALRNKKSAKIVRFLNDDSPKIALEAARSIHELPNQEALTKLAQLHKNRSEWISKFKINNNASPTESGIAMLYYVYHANFLLGKAEHLEAILSAGNDESLPESIRAMCLQRAKTWVGSDGMGTEKKQDRLQKTHNTTASKAVLKQVAEMWLASPNADQQEIMLDYVEAFGWREFKTSVASIFRTFNAKPAIRAQALKLLYQWEPETINPILNEALISNSALLRKEAVLIQSKLNATDQVAQWTYQLEFGEIKEKQEALMQLAMLHDRRVDAVILYWLERALKNNLPSALSQHLQQAAAQRTPPAVKKSLKQWLAAKQLSPEQN